MAGFLRNIKSKFSEMFSDSDDGEVLSDGEKEYLELDTTASGEKSKVTVRPFTMEDFSDIKMILDVLREGSTIALVNIKPLKDKDVIELKRAINKLKKTSDAIGGDIAGFGDDFVVVTPGFAKVYRAAKQVQQPLQAAEIKVDDEA
ncbi:cell division protein SepF [Candidatus Woesearchaeota archaeon]|nr:cell division protein SepF [Candidatus Woesearchaeota archaeon]